MRPEIKSICNELIDEHAVFDFDDAIAFCVQSLYCLELCSEELGEALAHVAIGLEVEQDEFCLA